MAERSLFPVLNLPRPVPAPQEKAYPASGVSFVSPDGTASVFLIGGPQSQFTTEKLQRDAAFAVSAYCFTVIRWRANALASAPLMVVRETSDGQEWQPNHDLARILSKPRPDLQMGEVLARTQMYRDITGGAAWTTDLDRLGRRAMVTPYSADEFRTFAVPPLIYGRYEFLRGNGEYRPVPLDQVVHFREVNPGSWRSTVSLVDAALMNLDLGHNVNRIVHSFLRKAMFPGGIISPDPKWSPTPKEWEAWKEMVNAWYAGPANHGAPLAVPGGTVINQVNTGLKDLLPEELLDRVEATIGAVFGVPPVVMGWLAGLKNSPWSQMADARRQAYEDTVSPLWDDYADRLTTAWLTEQEQAAGLLIRFDTKRVVALKNDNEQQARISALTADILTRNERRLLVGAEPLPDDDPRGEEITGGIQQGAPQSVGNGEDPGSDPNADPNADPANDGTDAGKSLNYLGLDRGIIVTVNGEAKVHADTKDLLWLIFDSDCKAAESVWETSIYQHLQTLKDRVLKAARAEFDTAKAAGDPVTEASTKDFKAKLEKILEEDAPRLAAKTYPLLVSTGTTAVKRLTSRMGLSFSLLEPGLKNYAKEESVFLARVMGQTTGDAVAKAVQAGLDAGETIRSLTKRLEELPEFDRDRAKMTARTETTRAWNGAQRRSMSDYQKRTGKQATKSWLSSRDSRVRDEHIALDDGEFIAIDATFANGLTEPGEPNCRCTLLYGFSEAPSGD